MANYFLRWRWLLLSIPLGIALLYLLSRPVDAQPVTELVAPRPIVWSDFLGVNAHFLWFTPEQYQHQMLQLKALGLKWVRVDLHWDRHEPKENQFQLSMVDQLVGELQTQNLDSLFYLEGSASFASSAPADADNRDQYPPTNPAIFADRMVKLAQRYPGVNAWQVWNEPNTPAFWRPHEDPVAYAQLFAETYRALHKVIPEKPIVLAGMAYYSQMPVKGGLMLEELAKLGVFNLNPVVDYHPYSLEPEGDDSIAKDFILRTIEVNKRLRAINVKKIWATEWGWSSYSGPKEEQAIIGQNGQADYLLRRLALMSAMDFDRIFLFALSDLDSRATPRDRGYGLLDLNGKAKPAYTALAKFLEITGPALSPSPPPKPASNIDGLISIGWKKMDGTHLWMFWGRADGSIQLSGIDHAILYNPLTGSQRKLQADNPLLTVPVIPQLQILEWN